MPELTLLQNVMLFTGIGAVAFLYSSVGHGGATGYLAVAALLDFTPAVARPGALWMNCVVASIAFWRFKKGGFFDGQIFWRLAIASIPCAWFGSRMRLEGNSYHFLLAVTLLAAGWSLVRARNVESETPPHDVHLPFALAVGGTLGLLAGMTGIGGGVFLTPFLIFSHWAPAKVAGGISALFIVANSIAGLAGLGNKGLVWHPVFMLAVASGITGALMGTWLGVSRWRDLTFRRALASVLWIAAGRLLLAIT